MLHTSSTTLASYQYTVFTSDTIVFFGFPSGQESDREVQRFTSLCDEKSIHYHKLSFETSPLWHYVHCYEIAATTLNDLEFIAPVIEQFGELNGFAYPDETVIVLKTRQELHELYTMISQLSQERENASAL